MLFLLYFDESCPMFFPIRLLYFYVTPKPNWLAGYEQKWEVNGMEFIVLRVCCIDLDLILSVSFIISARIMVLQLSI